MRSADMRHGERGVTIVFVALAMVAIIAIAALSIDVVTLYLAREEAQRSADAAALAAAHVLSLSGVTGDPNNTQGNLPSPPWQRACASATQVAQAVVNQNAVGRLVANTVNVTFLYNGTVTDCTAGGAFAVNPQVKVDVVQRGLPTFFSRIWRQTGSQVSATATAEAFNPSYSSSIAPNGLTTVNPKCVKPWVVPNLDPINSGDPFVMPNGSIRHPGIQINGTGPAAVIGETFELVDDCATGNPHCKALDDPIPTTKPPNLLEYIPASIGGTTVGVPSCATGSAYQEAIGGCDQNTVYACGIVGGGAQLDLTFNPGKSSGDTARATECLIHQSAGQDVLDTSDFPFRIQPGAGNPVLIANPGITNVSGSNSIVTLPIYDGAPFSTSADFPPINIVGFLQVFVNAIQANGNINVTVLNVAGCSNTATTSTPAVSGTSPVPVRLITPQ